MIRECFVTNTGIQFHRDSFKGTGLDPDTLFPVIQKRPEAIKPSTSMVTELRASAHEAEASEATLTDNVEAQGSPLAASSFKSEEEEELEDALSPIYDELKVQFKWSIFWWILEIFPLRHRVQNRKEISWPWRHYWS